MDIRLQFSIVWRSKWLIALVCVLAGGVSYYITSLQPKIYEATATAIVGQSLNAVGLDINSLLASQRLSATYATIATTRPLLDRVIAKEGLNVSADALSKRVFSDAPLNSTLINVTVSDTSPDRAAAIANDIVNELIAASPTIQGRESGVQKFIDDEFAATQQDIENVRSQIDALSTQPALSPEDDVRLQQLRNNLTSLRSAYSTLLSYSSGTAANGLSVIQPAIPPIDSAGPRVLVNTMLGLMAGLIAIIALVFIRDYLDDTIKRGDQVEEALGIATLGTIARLRGRGHRAAYHLVTRDDSRSPAAEAFGTLTTNIDFARLDAPVQTLLVTSALGGEGKSTVAANLAIAYAHSGRRTLLVDADVRKPGVHRLFELSNSSGLTTLVRSDHASLDKIVQMTDVANLSVLTTGPLPPNPPEVLKSQRMQRLMERLREDGSLVILDSPPVGGLADSLILASLCDATLVVVRAGRTRREVVRRTLDALAHVDAPVIGIVLNMSSDKVPADYYYSRAAATEATG